MYKKMKVNKNWLNKSGIYKISFRDKCYIGSTVDLYMRLAQHISHLKSNVHHSKYMQRCYNKYGKHEFKIEILEYCDRNIELLRSKELYYINMYNSSFNSTTPITYEHSERVRKEISETLKKKYKNKEIINSRLNCGKKLWGYDFEGNLLFQNLSSEEASKILKLSNRHVIDGALRNKRPIINKKYIVLINNDFKMLYDYIKSKKGNEIKLYKISKNNLVEECSSISRKRLLDKVLNSKDFIYYSTKTKKYYTFIGLINKCRLREEIPQIITAELSKEGENPNLNRRIN